MVVIPPLLFAWLDGLWDGVFSTQGIMIMLLMGYAGAMWLFLSSAPKVFTIMVSDLELARQFYEQELRLPIADVPLHYYYNYEQTLGIASLDPLYVPSALSYSSPKRSSPSDGLWYQLKKNTQLHVISGASKGERNRQRHVCFDRECLEMILQRIQRRQLRYKMRSDRPLNFLVKDYDDRVIEFAEINARP